jgi:hypothetical protein
MTRLLCPTLCVIAAMLAPACVPRSRPAPGVPASGARAPEPARALEPALAATAPRVGRLRVPIRDMTPEGIGDELWPETRVSYVPMSAGDRERLGALVAGLTAAARSGGDVRALAARAREIGFRVEIWRVRGRVFWALLEARAQRRGAGAYLIRPGPHLGGQPEIVLQAPHVFFDLGTGHIAAAMFFGWEGRGRARALFTNTVYRYAGAEDHAASAPGTDAASAPGTDAVSDAAKGAASAPGTDATSDGATEAANAPATDAAEPETRAPADVAHAADHAFQAATEAIVRELDQVVVIQLHGFAERPTRPEIVLSSGADEIGALLPGLATGLSAIFERVLRYPEELDELGGTRNVQGRMLALHPRAHFVHVELSARTRARLGATPALLARFAHTVLSLGERPQRP